MNANSEATTFTTRNPLRTARERDALQTRVKMLEGALACIEREAELALAEPGIAFLVTRRVAAIAGRSRA